MRNHIVNLKDRASLTNNPRYNFEDDIKKILFSRYYLLLIAIIKHFIEFIDAEAKKIKERIISTNCVLKNRTHTILYKYTLYNTVEKNILSTGIIIIKSHLVLKEIFFTLPENGIKNWNCMSVCFCYYLLEVSLLVWPCITCYLLP